LVPVELPPEGLLDELLVVELPPDDELPPIGAVPCGEVIDPGAGRPVPAVFAAAMPAFDRRVPVAPTFTMMSPNSSVVVSRATVSIGSSNVCPGRAGGAPTTPAGASRFW